VTPSVAALGDTNPSDATARRPIMSAIRLHIILLLFVLERCIIVALRMIANVQ